MLWSIFITLEPKRFYLFYSITYNCNKDVEQKLWIIQSPFSYNFIATDQPPSQLSWSALSPIYGLNPTAIKIKITITNIPVNLNCKEHLPHHQCIISIISIPYHHHHHHHHHRIFKNVTTSKTVNIIFIIIFVVTVIIKSTTIIATIININYYFSCFYTRTFKSVKYLCLITVIFQSNYEFC